jgi:hypothetical protein
MNKGKPKFLEGLGFLRNKKTSFLFQNDEPELAQVAWPLYTCVAWNRHVSQRASGSIDISRIFELCGAKLI